MCIVLPDIFAKFVKERLFHRFAIPSPLLEEGPFKVPGWFRKQIRVELANLFANTQERRALECLPPFVLADVSSR